MIKVTYIPCLFEDKRYEFESRNLNLTSVFHSLLKRYPEIRGDSPNITIRVNGKKIHPVAWAGSPLEDGDRVLILQDFGFEGILAAIFGPSAIIGVSIGGTVIGLNMAGWATVLTVGLTLASVIYSYSATDKPSYGSQGQGLANSPTYGWDGMQMQIRTGIPVPITYGEHTVGGNVCHTILASF